MGVVAIWESNDDSERITSDSKVMFGKQLIRGTRITVELIRRKIGGV